MNSDNNTENNAADAPAKPARQKMVVAAIRLGLFPLDSTVECIAEDGSVTIMVSQSPTIGFATDRLDHIFWPFTASTENKEDLTGEFLSPYLMGTLAVLNFQHAVTIASPPEANGKPEVVMSIDRSSIRAVRNAHQVYGTFAIQATKEALANIVDLQAQGGQAAQLVAQLLNIPLDSPTKNEEQAVPAGAKVH